MAIPLLLLSPEFQLASWQDFHRAFKKEALAWAYGSHAGAVTSNDHFYMYLMGGEL